MRVFVGWATILVGVFATGVGARQDQNATRQPSMEDVSRAAEAWEADGLVTAYRARGLHGPWDVRAEAFLVRAAGWLVEAPWGVSVEQIEAEARALLKEGCHDPIVQVMLGRALRRAGRISPGEATDLLRHGAAGLDERKYPAWRSSLTWQSLADQLTAWKNPEEAASARARGMERLTEALKAPDISPAVTRFLLWKLRNGIKDATMEEAEGLVRAVRAAPEADEWLVLMVGGYWEQRQAWAKRGTGFAGTVTPEGWAGFAEHLGKARELYEQAAAGWPDRPEAATAMIAVAMAGHAAEDEDERFWFDRAVRAEFDHLPAYIAMRWALRPRWGGSHAAMIEFGLECAASNRPDTMVPLELLNAVCDVCEERAGYDLLRERPELYERISAAIAPMVGQEEHACRADWLKSLQAVLAWRAGRPADARPFMDALDGKVDRWALGKFRGIQEDLDAAVYPATGAVAAQVAAADELGRAGRWDDAAAAFGELRRTLPPTEPARAAWALHEREVLAGFQASYSTGDWAKLPVERELPGWRPVAGAWLRYSGIRRDGQPDTDAVLGGQPDLDGLRAFFAGDVGPRWELKATVRFTSMRRVSGINGGVLFLREYTGRRENHLALRLYPLSGQASVARNFAGTNRVPLPPGDGYAKDWSISLSVWDDHAIARLDGVEVFNGRLPVGVTWNWGEQLGFGGYYTMPGYGALIIRDAAVRRIGEPPDGLRLEERPARDRNIDEGDDLIGVTLSAR